MIIGASRRLTLQTAVDEWLHWLRNTNNLKESVTRSVNMTRTVTGRRAT